MIELIEKFSLGKYDLGVPSEDRIVFTEHIAAVIDGSSSEVRREDSVFQLLLDEACERVAGINEHSTINELASSLSCLFLEYGVMASGAGLFFAIYNSFAHQVWSIGDCQFRTESAIHTNPAPSERLISLARAEFLNASIQMGVLPTAPSLQEAERLFMNYLISAQRGLANDPAHSLGYGVINGTLIPDKFLREIDIEYSTAEIILGTDGYPELFTTLAATEDHLKRVQVIDPYCIRENIGPKGIAPGQVSFDDRAYIRVRIR